jgi:hypothetical protein
VTASENDDYIPRRVNVTIEPGKGRTKTVKFDIVDDNLLEATEEFKVAVVSSSVPAVTWGDPLSVNILDNDGIYVVFYSLIVSNWFDLVDNAQENLTRHT